MTIIGVVFVNAFINAQCIYDVDTPIPDNGATNISLIVSGLVDSNLSSPTQGICGIEIEFDHEYLGDLTITLVSPSGTSVVLIGPPTTAITPTNLSRWNIDFAPCLSGATPDPGFTSIWSNVQAWQALATYTGTYHPQMGCLEDFNNGSANGLWQIIVEDHTEFQLGTIYEISLLFCNPAGLACMPCSPNAGTLSPASFAICSGDNIQSSDIVIDFGGNPPATSIYAYEYVLLSGNTILQSGTNFSITPPIGNYFICGLNYLIADSTRVNNLLTQGDYNLLTQEINQGLLCAALTSSCVAVNVSGKPDTIRVTGDLCGGEMFSYGGQNYFTDGVFYQLKDGPGLCDTTVEIRIHPRSLFVNVNTPDTLFCGSGDVLLQATPGGGPGPFTYQWSTINGNITSPTSGSSITVNQSGQYFVDVTDGICEGSGSANVIAGPNFPQVFFSGGTITCTTPIVSIKPIFTPTNGAVLWNGPMGFTSTQPNIGVTVPGTYTLNITNMAGCTTTRSVDVGLDTSTFQVEIIVINKDCENQEITLGDALPHLLAGWQWNGPNGFTTNFWRPIISDPGLYIFTATFPNGCIRTDTYLLNEDFSIPDISISPRDTLNCNEIITLDVSSNTPGVTYEWTGPGGFFSTQSSVQVDQGGTYIATVFAPTGCFISDTVIIDQGDDVFDFQTVTDTLTCSKTMVTIGVISSDADLYEWLNYNGPDADQSMIQVSIGGNYIVRMTNTLTGCEVTAFVFVYEDFRIPAFSYTVDTINCHNPISDLEFVPQPGYTYSSIFWELPDLTIVQGPSLMSNLSGIHKLIGISPNGCQSVRQVMIPFDTLSPFLILETDTLICNDTVQIFAQSLDSVSTFQWTGPGIIDFNGLSVNVDQPGLYHFIATGPNGCPSAYDIRVDSNFVQPSYGLNVDSLRCDQPGLLMVTPANNVQSYYWYDPNNVLISTDSFLVVTQPGAYNLEIHGRNQCIAFDTITIDSLQFPDVTLTSDTFSCITFSVAISAAVDIGQYSIAWVDINNDTISLNSMINDSTAGPFITSVTGLNGCTSRDTISPPFDTLAPMAIIAQVGDVRCQNREIVLDGFSPNPPSLVYAWSTFDGLILSNPSLSQINILDTGLYFLSITNLVNGCIALDSLQVAEHPESITNAFLDVHSPVCHGEGNGSVTIDAISGGVGMISYQLDGGAIQASPLFAGLNPGNHLLTIIDQENCVFDTTVQIDTSVVFSVDAGPDIEIYIGEQAVLTGTTDLAPDLMMVDQWNFSDGILCTDCPMYEVSPLETTSFGYQVTSLSGCALVDEMIVYVIEKARLFIANVFSPNGDGINDEIRINSTGGIEKVVQWTIYDRWGNAVFGAENFDPMDLSVFWDGRTSTGQFSNPGVFPYVIELQLISGKSEVAHGEITLLR